jgi:hypothetical protein
MTKKMALTLADETGKRQALPWNVVASQLQVALRSCLVLTFVQGAHPSPGLATPPCAHQGLARVAGGPARRA